MRVLLVVKNKSIETLGVMYLSAVIKRSGHEATIADIDNAYPVASVWRPEVIGYSVMTGDRERFMALNAMIKTGHDFVSIVGGPDPTFFPKGYGWADHVVRGEGENWLADFLASKRLKTDMYPDLDSIPWPDRTDFSGMKIRDFIASRGCPFNCAYCYNQQWADLYPGIPRVRTRPVDDVIAEVKSVGAKFNYFQDSCFGLNRKWLIDFAEKYFVSIKKPHSKEPVPFHCHLRPSQINNEMASHLAMAGCYSVRFALETASDKLRKIINREHTSNEETYQAAKLCRKWNIKFMIQNILGLPESTIEDDLETLEVNIDSRPDYAWCSIFQPYPGTKLADMCIENGYYTGDFSEISDSFFDESVLNFTEEHKEQLVCLQRVFALCCEVGYLPWVEELTYDNFPKLIHKVMRKQGDSRLYAGVL